MYVVRLKICFADRKPNIFDDVEHGKDYATEFNKRGYSGSERRGDDQKRTRR